MLHLTKYMADIEIKWIINLRMLVIILHAFENTRHHGIWNNNVLCSCETHCCTLMDVNYMYLNVKCQGPKKCERRWDWRKLHKRGFGGFMSFKYSYGS